MKHKLWLLVFLAACGKPETPSSDLSFGSGEHMLLGNRAYELACQQSSRCPPHLVRADGQQTFTYGELVALQGDFYEQPTDLYLEETKGWFGLFRKDARRTKKLFYRELASIQAMMDPHSEVRYPDLNVLYALTSPGYVRMGEQNDDHFGFYNVLRYIAEHDQAIAVALHAHQLREAHPEQAETLFQQALFRNSFADHFLSDGFASGHLRNPRLQTRRWASERGLSVRTAGLLTKLIHDRDGEMRVSGEHGLPVMNARGDRWFARCDTQLFWQVDGKDPAIQWTVEALAASLEEVLLAFETGEKPPLIPKALWFVPFPSEEAPPLSELLSPDRTDIRALYRKLAWYFKLPFASELNERLIAQYLTELPLLMAMLRADVQQEFVQNPTLALRFPEAYRQAVANLE